MLSVSRLIRAAISIGFALVITCGATASEVTDAERKLARLGAELEYDDHGNLIAVDFGLHPLTTGGDLSLLSGRDRLAVVRMSEMPLGSDVFEHLATLSALKHLDASKTKCTDTDIEHLEGLARLEELDLSDTAVTDASIATLMTLPALRWVDLSSTRVTPEGLRRIRRKLPKVHLSERWNYFAGIVGGRGVLDMDRATIFFGDVQAPRAGTAGAGGGGSIRVSIPHGDEREITASRSGGGLFGSGSFGTVSLSASVEYVDGVPIIHVGEHKVEIRNGGTEVVVDGERFTVKHDKLRIKLSAEGTATVVD